LKLKCDSLIALGEYDATVMLCEQVLAERSVIWASVGLGKVYFFKEEYDLAKSFFDSIIVYNNTFVIAYDWLAKIHVKRGESQQAQEVLMQAVQLSPRSTLRQRALDNAALINEDYEVAEKAGQQAVRSGKNSVLKQPSDYVCLEKILCKKQSYKEALKILESGRREFINDLSAELEFMLAGRIVHKEMGNDKQAEEKFKQAINLYSEQRNCITSRVAMDLAKAYFDQGKLEEVNRLIKQVIRNHYHDERLLSQIHRLYNDMGMEEQGNDIISTTQERCIALSNEGVRLAEQGKLEESISLFEKAVKWMPHNPIINLHAAQSLVMHLQKKGVNRKNLIQAMNYLKVVHESDESNQKCKQLMAVCRAFPTLEVA